MNKLKLLIEYYETEIATLQQLLKNELETEVNYQAAGWYQNGLAIATSEYNKLKNLSEPFVSPKARLAQRMEWIREELSAYKKEDESYCKFSILLQLTEDEYQQVSGKNLPEVVAEPHLFDQAINKVFNKEIKGVHLMISEDTGLCLEIVRKQNKAAFSITRSAKQRAGREWDEYQLKRLILLGFEVKKRPLRLVKSFPMKEKSADALKTLLARCYFEVLQPHAVHTQGYIVYIN